MRESGILMPVSSLPGPYGIGCFGKAAFQFVDFLSAAGQTIWQLLPLSPTGYGDSPYQSCSAFAGNPYFVDLEALEKEGLLTAADLKAESWGKDPLEVDYGTFMSMTEEKNIGKVDIESNQIIFTDKDNTQVYKTGLMDDSGLTERLYTAGAEFSSEIVEQSSPVLSFLIWFVLPIILFSAIGNQMNKKLMEKDGRPQLHDVWRHGQIQRQGLRPVHRGHPLLGCGR